MNDNNSFLHLTPCFTGLSEQISIHGRFRAREIALIDGDYQLDWAEYNDSGNRIGNRLRAEGVARGDRVALVVNNHIWAHEILLGIWRAGAVAVPLSPMLDADSMGRMLKDSGAVAVFTSTDYEELVSKAAESDLPRVTEGEPFAKWLGDSSANPTPIDLKADDLAVIIYSSGTTGVPKGIAHSHAARLSFASGFAAEFRFHYRSVALSAIPMHSNGAWLSWSPAMWIGATTVILPEFTPDGFIDCVKKHAPTHGFIVPAMAKALLAHPEIEQAGLDCFEAAITAGSPMMEDTQREISRLTGNALYELWGLTEGVATIISPADKKTRPGSVGRPMLGCDIRIIDSLDRDVTFTGEGEIVGHSTGQMSGYWNRPDANAELIWRDEHGQPFICTGDVGEFDEDGYLTLRGRIKDMIISGGLNVYPVDIEARLIRHHAVLDAVVVGTEDEKWGETPVGFVILKPSQQDIDPDSIRSWANKHLAVHQRLSRVCVHTGDFPRNTLGKVLKPQLKALL